MTNKDRFADQMTEGAIFIRKGTQDSDTPKPEANT